MEDIKLLCGSTASFDYDSGISYRCNTCCTTVNSISMPYHCKELYDIEESVRRLKGNNTRKKYTECEICKEKFTGTNVFTQSGWLETQITGTCEKCFDNLFDE